MARLGRGRREGARIRRNVSAPTPTPLVRKRLTQTPTGNDRAHIVARFWRRKRAHIVLRAPSTPPVIRKRLVQSQNSNDRAWIVARAFRRHRAHIVLRSTLPPAATQKPQQPIVSRADIRATSRTRGFQPRGARIIRNVSAPTPTPLVKPVVVLGRNRGKAARARAFFGRHAVQFVRPPIIAAVPFVRHPQVITSATSRAVRVRAHMRRRPRLLRAPVVVPVTVRVAQPIVSHSTRAVQIRAHARHRARILRAPVATPVAARPRQPIVTHTRAAVRVRYTRPRNTLLLRSNVYVVQTKTVPRLVLGRNNHKAALVRSYYKRHRAHLETSTLGTATPPVTFTLGAYDMPHPIDVEYAAATRTASFDPAGPSDGAFTGTTSDGSFDRPRPRQVVV